MYFVPIGFSETGSDFPVIVRSDIMLDLLVNNKATEELFEVDDTIFAHLKWVCEEMKTEYKVIVGIPDLASPLAFHNVDKLHVVSLLNHIAESTKQNENLENQALKDLIEKELPSSSTEEAE